MFSKYLVSNHRLLKDFSDLASFYVIQADSGFHLQSLLARLLELSSIIKLNSAARGLPTPSHGDSSAPESHATFNVSLYVTLVVHTAV